MVTSWKGYEVKLSEIDKRARGLGIKDTWKYARRDLIRIIQLREGNFDCFGTARDYCDQSLCSWREYCLNG